MTIAEARELKQLADALGSSMATILRLGVAALAEQEEQRPPLGSAKSLIRQILAALAKTRPGAVSGRPSN